MHARYWSLNAASVELGMDRRSLARKLEGLDPDREDGRSKQWLMRRMVGHIFAGRGDDELDLNSERARKEKEQADNISLRNAQLRGELVAVLDVESHWVRLVSDSRARLLALPGAVAPLVAHETGIAPCKDIIERAVHEALAELATGGIPAESDGDMAATAEVDGEPVGGPEPAAKPRGKRRARAVAH